MYARCMVKTNACKMRTTLRSVYCAGVCFEADEKQQHVTEMFLRQQVVSIEYDMLRFFDFAQEVSALNGRKVYPKITFSGR